MKPRNTAAVSGLDTEIVLSDVVSLVEVLDVVADSVIETVSVVVVVTVSVTSVYSVTTTGGCSGSIIVIDRKNVRIYPFFLF